MIPSVSGSVSSNRKVGDRGKAGMGRLTAKAEKYSRGRKKHYSRKRPLSIAMRNWLWPAIGVLVFGEVLLLGAHAVRWMMTSPRFVLGEVKVVGHQILAPKAIVQLAGLKSGKNIFEFDLEKIRRRIDSNPWVRRSSVRKSPPNTLRIEIEERKPIALVNNETGVAVDLEGVILGSLPPKTAGCLPVLEGFSEKRARPGDRIENSSFSAAVIAASLYSGASFNREKCLKISPAKNGRLRIRIMEGKAELLVGGEKLEAQAARFHAVAMRIFKGKIPSGAPMLLDLTFPGRIIVRSANKNGGLEG